MEDKKKYGRIQRAPYSLDLLPFYYAFLPHMHGKRLSDLEELCTDSLKKTWFCDIYGKWVQLHRKCVQHQKEYLEKMCHSPD